jgi:hypothetical protein
MKLYLILGALAAWAVCHAQGVTRPGRPDQARALPVQLPKQTGAAPPRHLSEAERAELRRQLWEFNRRYGKRS